MSRWLLLLQIPLALSALTAYKTELAVGAIPKQQSARAAIPPAMEISLIAFVLARVFA